MTWNAASALAPAGPQAARLAQLYWVFFTVCAVVYVIVLILVGLSLSRGESPSWNEGRRLRFVAFGGALTTLILLGLLLVSVRAGHGLNPMRGAAQDGVLTVRVIARQWWWEFQYPGSRPDELITTANEMHIPVGRPVLLELRSRDVIHSFWVPALHGKRDLIPGHDSTTYLQADRPGRFRGQCAEFCGAQHAKMGLLVVAEPAAAFEAWRQRQRKPAEDLPATAQAQHGRELFLRSSCPMCHTVGGTTAGAIMGPNLTHIASRVTLGAGSVANVHDQLSRWIRDSHSIKPGNQMPPIPWPQNDLEDVVAYLETLR